MAKLRSDLSDLLHTVCDNVYFQPPTGTRMSYPCIVYDLDRTNVQFADNTPYVLYDEYSLKYITRDPDDPARNQIIYFPYCSSERFFIVDNLYHYIFRMYW